MKFGAMTLAGVMAVAGIGIASRTRADIQPLQNIEDRQDEENWVPLADKKSAVRNRPVMTPAYRQAVVRTAEMASNESAKRLAEAEGLDILNLTWEDTGRYKNSSVGPNISDMTIQVEMKSGRENSEIRCMPVIRYPNFSDKTCDIDARDFTLLVGNQKGSKLRRMSLYDFLSDPTAYLSNPRSWLGQNRSLLAPRDEKVLVSAQAAFLPIPREGSATFNPVLFNYQSVSGDPGVLTILATREGTSVTVIDNKRDGFNEGGAWGQRLFHNDSGMRASLTGERLSDFKAGTGATSAGGHEQGLGMVLLIQVPLKQKNVRRYLSLEDAAMPAPASGLAAKAVRGSDVEQAVIGHGESEGPFTEIDHLKIDRDPNFPVRVTVQFYKATSNGVVNGEDISAIKHEIDSVYEHSDSVGSLVVEGETGRPTEYIGCKVEPADWWQQFWQRYEANTGVDRQSAIQSLQKLLGNEYENRPVSELYLRNLLRNRR